MPRLSKTTCVAAATSKPYRSTAPGTRMDPATACPSVIGAAGLLPATDAMAMLSTLWSAVS